MKVNMQFPYTSILGGGIARAMIQDLNPKDPTKVVRRTNANGLSFSLRYCYRREGGFWNGHTYQHKVVPTGGLILKVWGPSESDLSLPDFRRDFRIRPADVPRLEKVLGHYVTCAVRLYGIEVHRQRQVLLVHRSAEPLISIKEFIADLEKQEKVWGLSNYDKMTAEQAWQWLDWVNDWKIKYTNQQKG